MLKPDITNSNYDGLYCGNFEILDDYCSQNGCEQSIAYCYTVYSILYAYRLINHKIQF